ncbi:PREDICTED: uncharacterized protein LOC109590517 [Amphimedon queenslandica]|uniref:Fibronectin type-II domain-containing protein n=1 Tax=Amphimedon queenslandica TaxID=400682 RepID=A0AAN0JYJ5_AMPQE|nr:PREDICTED: uncharacterized protein LOC109590517 [Amphimedon queenslandica]|eukprot:XP_019861978.1 PREDICTED: uncharacterized protein LOC109590517 [Amphimedon queenslandica]
MKLEFLALYVVLFGCMCISSANICCTSNFDLCSDDPQLQDTGIFDISLSCYNSTIHWNKNEDSTNYDLNLHETCYNVTTGEMLPDYPNCLIQGKRSSGNKSIRHIGEFDDVVCSYGGCIAYAYWYCHKNIPHIGNCTSPTQITHTLEQASSSSLSYSSSAPVSLLPTISPLPSSLQDIASFSSTYIVSSSSFDDSKMMSSFSKTSETSGTRESYNVSTSFMSLFPSMSSPIVPSITTLANGSLDLIYVLVSSVVTMLLCVCGLFVILLLLLIAKKKQKSRSKLTTDLILMDGPRIELFFEDLKGFSLQSGSMETVYTPLEGGYYSTRGHIDTRDKESVVTAASNENLHKNENEEIESTEEDGNELGGTRDENTVVSSEDSNESSFVSSGSSGFGNDDPGHLQFHGLTQLTNGYVESNGSVVESSGQSHEYVQLNNGHMVETTNRPTEASNGYIQTNNGSVESHEYIKEESSEESYGYVQVNTGDMDMNGDPETNGSILSNGYIQTNEDIEMMKFNGYMQSKSFITSDIKFENDYIPNNVM